MNTCGCPNENACESQQCAHIEPRPATLESAFMRISEDPHARQGQNAYAHFVSYSVHESVRPKAHIRVKKHDQGTHTHTHTHTHIHARTLYSITTTTLSLRNRTDFTSCLLPRHSVTKRRLSVNTRTSQRSFYLACVPPRQAHSTFGKSGIKHAISYTCMQLHTQVDRSQLHAPTQAHIGA